MNVINSIVLLVLGVVHFVTTKTVLKESLGGTWQLKDVNGEYTNLTASVPGGIYSDLMDNGIIGNIFFGFNDTETRWVAKKKWVYQKILTVDEDLLSYKNVYIVFDGIDTFATVQLNNETIGVADNMFTRYRFDTKLALKHGENLLEVTFDSPLEKANTLFEKQSEDYVVPPVCVPDEYNGECHVNHIRKMQASFSWDWGPAFPSVGIWKPVYFEAYNNSVISDVVVNIVSNVTTDSWDIELKTYFINSSGQSEIKGKLTVLLITDITVIYSIFELNLVQTVNQEYISINNVSVPKSTVSLWWPNGYGRQKLYRLKLTFVSEVDEEESSKEINIGFRTVELVQNELETGRAFYFKINEVPIFAKGSNIIPISILPEKGQNESLIRSLLQASADVHMNMLRVWGGGVYESDKFYEIADELGILIWQDFMFACSMYPTNEEFLSTVTSEVRHQVRRLQYHPSIVIWAGNNENEAAIRTNWYGTASNFSLYASDYVKLYIDTVKKAVLENDNTRSFLTSSPTNGILSDEENYIAENPYSQLYGDVHFYNYIDNSWNANIFPITRFASEYGYQSLPEVNSLLTATNNISDLHPNSSFLNHRQHHPGGYEEMKLLIDDVLKLPNDSSVNYYKAFVFYSQIVQAMAIKIQTEYYRQWRSNLNEIGEGLTMGALYWQLNDVWVAPSWSGIDFNNKWKMLHYYARNFFAPVIVTGHLTAANDVDVYIVSDLLTTAYNASLVITVYAWNSMEPVSVEKNIVDVLSGVSIKVWSVWITEYLSNYPKCVLSENPLYNCFIHLELQDSLNRTLAPNNFVFPAPLNAVDLVKPTLSISNVTQTDDRNFTVTVTTNAITLFVWLDAVGVPGTFSENGFLQVTPIVQVNFLSDVNINTEELVRCLTVTHLIDDIYLQ